MRAAKRSESLRFADQKIETDSGFSHLSLAFSHISTMITLGYQFWLRWFGC